MTPTAAESRQALLVGVFCYFIWGLTPALFITMGRAGMTTHIAIEARN